MRAVGVFPVDVALLHGKTSKADPLVHIFRR